MQSYDVYKLNPRNNSNSSLTTCDNNPQKRQTPFFAQKLVAKQHGYPIFLSKKAKRGTCEGSSLQFAPFFEAKHPYS
jgi:hypothetical protein